MKKGRPSVISRITPERLADICQRYHLGPEVQPEVPDEFHPISDPPGGKVGVYLLYLEGGLRFPVTDFFKSVLTFYSIHISQLNPSAVQKIVCFELLCRALRLDTSLIGFRYFYYTKMTANYWITFAFRHTRPNICQCSNDLRNRWKKDFFFIAADSFPVNMALRTSKRNEIDTCPDPTPELMEFVNKIKKHFVVSYNIPEVVLAAARMTHVPRFRVMSENHEYVVNLMQMLEVYDHRKGRITIVEEEAPPPPELGDLQENVEEAKEMPINLNLTL